ncbi:MAG: sulfotransferase family 2 domain-containing protein, partial [Synechococcales bacterium]|nr:sulfotransferase family 2 domain-containing protein [Synechococcales bacterium]
MFEKFYFLHIPKTAGTSLRYWLFDFFPVGAFLECYHLHQLKEKSPDIINCSNFYSGHFGIKIYQYLSQKPTTITWLRNPVEREISQYFYLKSKAQEFINDPDKPVLSITPAASEYLEAIQELSLPQLCKEKNIGYCDNLQVRYLAGLSPGNTEFQPCTANVLELAKENLANLDFFGVCEQMQASIILFCHKFNLPPKKFDLFLNRHEQNKGKETLFSPEDIEVIRENNKYDLELYAFANNLFNQRISSMLEQLSRDQKSFVTLEDYRGKSAIFPQGIRVHDHNLSYDPKITESLLELEIERKFQSKPVLPIETP